jgi:hypothetical protein
MKSLKAAVVLAGSMVVAGIAAPAVALDVAEAKSGVAGVVDKAAGDPAGLGLLDPAKASGAQKSGFVAGTVDDARTTLAQQANSHLLDGHVVQV